MRILKLYPKQDKPTNHNYHINYGLWDSIEGDIAILEEFDSTLSKYDFVFLPMRKRWFGNNTLLNKIKESGAKSILFDNDSCYHHFTDKFYEGIDFIFYRCLDRDKNKPLTKNQWLGWSIDTTLYAPKFGGKGILFSSSVSSTAYPLRWEIRNRFTNIVIKHDRGIRYIQNLQQSAASIHTDSDRAPVVRAKLIEISSCGTQIISNRTEGINYFFPDELIIYFDDIDHLQDIIKNYKVDISIQKELRYITETKHDNKVRANEVLTKISELL
jgi:hypothetical protein